MPQQPGSGWAGARPIERRHGLVGGHPDQCLLVAVAVQDGRGRQTAGQRRPERVRVALRRTRPGRTTIPSSRFARGSAGEQVRQLVVEDRLARRLQHHDRHARVQLRLERVEDLAEQPAALLQEAAVVERPAAAQVRARHLDREAGGLQNPQRRQSLRRREALGERVREQDDPRRLGVARAAQVRRLRRKPPPERPPRRTSAACGASPRPRPASPARRSPAPSPPRWPGPARSGRDAPTSGSGPSSRRRAAAAGGRSGGP